MQVWGRWRAPKARLTEQERERSLQSQLELGHGRLPLSSQERLADTGAPFTSDLTVAQLAALRSGGWEPVGQVFGSAVVTRSARYFRHPVVNAYGRASPSRSDLARSDSARPASTRPTWTALEVFGWYDADRAARSTALRRMGQEMERLGAHGAVGLRVLAEQLPGAPVAECTLMATAVRSVTPLSAAPFVTEMTAADLVALRRAGWVPCGALFTIGRYLTCGWDRGLGAGSGPLAGLGLGPRELDGPTDVANRARRNARAALVSQLARYPGASMVLHDLDVQLASRRCEGGQGRGSADLLADVTATGTAIVPATARSAPPPTGRLTVHPVVPLGAAPAPSAGEPS